MVCHAPGCSNTAPCLQADDQFAPDATPTFSGNQLDLAITPDGSRVFYVGNRGTQLFVRELGDLTPVALFTGVPRGPFVLADGQSIGFVDGTSVLKRVAVSGGVAVTMGTLDGLPRGASWGADGPLSLRHRSRDGPAAAPGGGWDADGPHPARPCGG